MKNIHVSQLKSESFNSTGLIEEVVEIHENLSQTYHNLKEVLGDLEGVREGLFFKREKLNLKIRSIEEGLKVDKMDELSREINGIRLESLGTSRDVLEMNREINHLKKIEKSIKYLIEVEKGNYGVLDALISSDSSEDWRFLCFFLFNVTSSLENEEVLKYNKMIEENMLEVFEEGNKQKNKTMMRSAYNALIEMKKENSLIHSYIYSLDLFKEPIKMSHKEESIIDFDFYVPDSNTFLDLINRIRDTYDNDFNDLGEIFPDPSRVYKMIYMKIYDDILYNALNEYLKDASPAMFLLSLESCHRNIKVLGSFIEAIDPDFDGDSAANDLVSQHVRTAVEKEKVLFDEIYGILVLNVGGISYIILGEKVIFSTDYVFVYKQLLNVVNFALERCRRFYGESDEDDLIEFFFRKINGFVGIVYDSVKDRFEVIRILKFIYLVSRKYFSGKFRKLGSFKNRISRKIQNAFEDEIETCRMRIGVRIKQETFMSEGGSERIIEITRYEVDKAKEMSVKGRHLKILVDKMFSFVYSSLYDRITQMVFDEERSKNLKAYVSDVYEFTRTLGCTEAIQRLGYLHDLTTLITIPSEDFESFYGTMLGRISDAEISKIIRSRKDREAIQAQIFGLNNENV